MGVALNANSSRSEVEPQIGPKIEERKRKRMESNRESAKRFRMRKQKQLDDLFGQVSQLQGANQQLADAIDEVQKKYSVLDIPEVPNMVMRPWQLPCPAQPIGTTSATPFWC